MNAKHNSISAGDPRSPQRPTYSAPRLQRLGRVSELTQAGPNGTNAYDGAAYIS